LTKKNRCICGKENSISCR